MKRDYEWLLNALMFLNRQALKAAMLNPVS